MRRVSEECGKSIVQIADGLSGCGYTRLLPRRPRHLPSAIKSPPVPAKHGHCLAPYGLLVLKPELACIPHLVEVR